jgi:hypothetical protein
MDAKRRIIPTKIVEIRLRILGGQFKSRPPASLDVMSSEHVEQSERTLSKKGYNRPCRIKLGFFALQLDESRDTFDDTELRAW